MGAGESVREGSSSERVGGKNPKKVWWKGEVKAVVKRKEAAGKVLAASYEEAKERCMEAYKEEKRTVKRCTYQSKKKVNEQFWKEVE